MHTYHTTTCPVKSFYFFLGCPSATIYPPAATKPTAPKLTRARRRVEMQTGISPRQSGLAPCRDLLCYDSCSKEEDLLVECKTALVRLQRLCTRACFLCVLKQKGGQEGGKYHTCISPLSFPLFLTEKN